MDRSHTGTRMTDCITITLEMRLKPESVDGMVALLTGALADTRAFPGNRSIRVLRNVAEPARLLFIEEWDSMDAYEAYLAFRRERGDFLALKPHLAAPLARADWGAQVA